MEYRDIHSSADTVKRYLKLISKTSMSEEQKKKIIEFVEVLKIGKAGKKVGDRRISSYLQFLVKLHKYFQQDLNKITEKQATQFYKDLQENKILRQNKTPYSIVSKDEYIKTLKRYLGWCWGRDSKKYYACIRWMKEDYKKSDKKAITLKQAEEILKKEKDVRNKCLFMFLFDSGARIEEALNVTIQDLKAVNGNSNYFMVHLRGTKTEEADRTIPIPLTTKYLNRWLKKHPTKKEEDFLFPIMYDNARRIVRVMSKEVIGEIIKPHELRHSSATHYIQHGGFGANNIGGFYYRYGWKFGSKEALTYIKTYLYGGELSQDKVVKAIVSDKVEYLENEQKKLKEIMLRVLKAKATDKDEEFLSNL